MYADEPTSGLDARAAAHVIRAVRTVAARRRTIICTVHQPNAALFAAFDDLLLLQARAPLQACTRLALLALRLSPSSRPLLTARRLARLLRPAGPARVRF